MLFVMGINCILRINYEALNSYYKCNPSYLIAGLLDLISLMLSRIMAGYLRCGWFVTLERGWTMSGCDWNDVGCVSARLSFAPL
jgi:hypothetical protein